MTQEEKQLLLKDFCARLPYNTIVNCLGNVLILKSIDYTAKGEIFRLKSRIDNGSSKVFGISIIKPYLRSMSSLTDEEENEYRAINCYEGVFPSNEDALDYALEHHLDIRNLIEKGLALEAPEGMYKKEESK